MDDNQLCQVRSDRPQKWMRISLLASLLILLVCIGVVVAHRTNEPQFEGKQLSVWLEKLDTGRIEIVDFRPVLDADAAEAMRQIGERAVPFLVARLEDALAAERAFYALQDWPGKVVFRFMEPRLDRRMVRGREAVLGFRALRERGSGAIPELAALIPGEEVRSLPVLEAIASTGPASLSVFSNALQSSDYSLPGNAAIASGLLGRAGAPLVPLLISMLDDPKHDRICPFIIRALGRIGEPEDLILPALRQSLGHPNDSIAGNAALGLMLLGDAGHEALPEIEQRWVKNDGKANLFSLLAYVVLSTNDTQTVESLDRIRIQLGADQTLDTACASSARSPFELFAQVRSGWTNTDVRGRREILEALRELLPEKGAN